MADGVIFTAEAGRRIAAAVLDFERNRPGSDEPTPSPVAARGFFRARLTGWNPDKPWQLGYTSLRPKAGAVPDPKTLDPDTLDADLWEDDPDGLSHDFSAGRYAWHPAAAPPIGSLVKLASFNPAAEIAKRCYLIVQPEQTGFWAKIVTAGPNSESDYTDARYWVREQTPSIDSSMKWTFADTAAGRHVTATNLLELGIGTSDAGLHGCLYKSGEAPNRGSALTAPTRYVRVHLAGRNYYFESMPFVFVEDSYYLDVYGVDGDGCPDAYKWWKGVIPFGVVDYDSVPP